MCGGGTRSPPPLTKTEVHAALPISIPIPSLEADASIRPLGEKATAQMMEVCPSNVRRGNPVATSHNRLAKSSELPPAEARAVPSGEKARLRRASPWPKVEKIERLATVSTPSPAKQELGREGLQSVELKSWWAPRCE